MGTHIMFEKLAAAGEQRAVDAVNGQIKRFASKTAPRGIQIEASLQGVVLSGKRLRHRFVTDPELRNFAR